MTNLTGNPEIQFVEPIPSYVLQFAAESGLREIVRFPFPGGITTNYLGKTVDGVEFELMVTNSGIRSDNNGFHHRKPGPLQALRLIGIMDTASEKGIVIPRVNASRTTTDKDGTAHDLLLVEYIEGSNLLEMAISGDLNEHPAIQSLGGYIARRERANKGISPESIAQRSKRPSVEDYRGVFMQNANEWLQSSIANINSKVGDPILRDNLTDLLTHLGNTAALVEPSLLAIGGMHGDPNYSKLKFTAEGKLVVTGFHKDTSWYLNGYDIASHISYAAVQLASLLELDSIKLVTNLFREYLNNLTPLELIKRQESLLPVIAQRLIGDSWGVISNPTTQEGLSVDLTRVYGNVSQLMPIIRDMLANHS